MLSGISLVRSPTMSNTSKVSTSKLGFVIGSTNLFLLWLSEITLLSNTGGAGSGSKNSGAETGGITGPEG